MAIEGSGSRAGPRSGSIPQTNGSGSRSRRPKNMWIRSATQKKQTLGMPFRTIPQKRKQLRTKPHIYTICCGIKEERERLKREGVDE
jgi:hypothetical protein